MSAEPAVPSQGAVFFQTGEYVDGEWRSSDRPQLGSRMPWLGWPDRAALERRLMSFPGAVHLNGIIEHTPHPHVREIAHLRMRVLIHDGESAGRSKPSKRARP